MTKVSEFTVKKPNHGDSVYLLHEQDAKALLVGYVGKLEGAQRLMLYRLNDNSFKSCSEKYKAMFIKQHGYYILDIEKVDTKGVFL